VVDWSESGDPEYFGIYKKRTHLNIETLQLEIHRLTLADSGTFSLETEKGTVGTYLVQVIRKCVCVFVTLSVCVCVLLCV